MAEQKTEVTRMVAPSGRKVRIEAIRPLAFNADDGTAIRLAPGQTAEVSEELAQQFCAPISGVYSFSGERSTPDASRHTVLRAKIV